MRFVVLNPAAFPPTGEYIGLDARTALPPLLRPGMLLDWESWWKIEAAIVDVLLDLEQSGVRSAGTRATCDSAAASVDARRRSARVARHCGVRRRLVIDARCRTRTLVDVAIGAIPVASRTGARWPTQVATSDTEARRFLAAHAFANWTIHLGDGLWPWWRSIETAAALIEAGAGIRHADLVLRHLIDPKAFARGLSYSAPMNG